MGVSNVTLFALTAMLAFTVAGCAKKPSAIRHCEDLLLPTLKAPSTYHLAEDVIGRPDANGKQDVFLTYDAANSYNAPIRSTFWCTYDRRSDSATVHNDESEMTVDNMEAADDTTSPPSTTAPPSKEEAPKVRADEEQAVPADEVPVCDRPDSDEKSALMNEIGISCAAD